MSSEIETAEAGGRVRMADIRAIEKKSGPAAAERAVVDFLRTDPKSVPAFVALSRILLKQQKYDDAARAAEKAKGIAPLEVEPVIALGFVHMRKKEYDPAGKAFAEAITLDPTSTRALLGAAAVKMVTEDYPAALDLCNKILEIDPSMERAKELTARIHLKQGDKAGALGVLQSLVVENPGNERALKAYMRLMRSEDRGDEAYTFIEDQAKADPTNRQRAFQLSRVAVRIGKPEVAVQQYKKFVDSGKARPDDKVRYIAALIENNELDEAEKMIGELGERRMVEPIAAKFRGDIALKAGTPDKAIEQYRLACKRAQIDPLSPEAEAEGETAEDKAKLWRSHTRKSIGAAIRERRQERAA